MNDIPWPKTLGRIAVVTAIGLSLSLVIGTLIAYVPVSPLEGMHAGVLAAGALLVLSYFAILRARRTPREKVWIFESHSVLGLATGMILSVIFLSGILLIYKSEIDVLLNPWLKIEAKGEYTAAKSWLDAVHSRTDLNTSNRIEIVWPESQTQPVRIDVSGPAGSERFFIDPYNANILDGKLRSKMGWVRKLHVTLSLGKAGHWLAGFVALAAVWLCIGGLTMGRNVFRDWHRLRFRRGLTVFLSDLHKRIGLWLLPFIAINAFAGMLAALFGILSMGPVEARFDGNYNALYEAVGSPQSVTRSDRSETPSVDEFIAMATAIMPDAKMRQLRILSYGDRNSIVSIRASHAGDIAPQGSSLLLNIRASTKEVVLQKQISNDGIFERLAMAFSAFHLASYGGNGVRALHAITALFVSVLPIVGMGIWYLRRRRNRNLAK